LVVAGEVPAEGRVFDGGAQEVEYGDRGGGDEGVGGETGKYSL